MLFSVVKAEWFNDCQSRCDSFYALKCERALPGSFSVSQLPESKQQWKKFSAHLILRFVKNDTYDILILLQPNAFPSSKQVKAYILTNVGPMFICYYCVYLLAFKVNTIHHLLLSYMHSLYFTIILVSTSTW